MIKTFKEYTLDEVCDFLREKKNTLIIFHVRPDADAIGASYALKLVLEAMGSKVLCTCESEIPSRLAFLTDKHQRSARFENIDNSFEFERVITVDTASPSQLGNLQKLFEDKIDIMIDHHENGIRYADNYIRSDYAASGEIVFEIASRLVERGELDALLSAIEAAKVPATDADLARITAAGKLSEYLAFTDGLATREELLAALRGGDRALAEDTASRYLASVCPVISFWGKENTP